MAFGILRVKAVEGLLSFKNTISHRSTWHRQPGMRKRDSEE